MTDYGKFSKVSLDVKVEDKVAVVTINRPERRNALGEDTHEGLEELLQTFNYDKNVNAVVITGAGDKAFCAGADVKAMAERTSGGADARPLGSILRGAKWLIHNFLNLEQPIIAAINGDAVGLGASIALMCDVTIMADTARIGDTHVRVGLVAGDGGALMWPFLVGMSRAKEALMTGRLLNADECDRIGLVTRVVPQAQCLDEAMSVAQELARGAPLAVRWTKAACNQHIWAQVVNTHHFALGVEALSMASYDAKEGPAAFVEKRPGNFQGR